MSPNILHDIKAGKCLRTLYVSAGNDGKGPEYWLGREAGERAAYAEMAGVANSWTQADAGLAGHPIPVFTLAAAPRLSLAHIRLPDSDMSTNQWEGLRKVWEGDSYVVHAVDGTSAYTNATLISTLLAFMINFQPDRILTLDYVNPYDDDNHDHHTVGYWARAAHRMYKTPHTFLGHEGYAITNLPSNVFDPDYTAKLNAFLAYAPYDTGMVPVCLAASTCLTTVNGPWLSRQYVVGTETGGIDGGSTDTNIPPMADAGRNQVVTSGSIITLDGSGSTDLDGNALSYQWTQKTGPNVVLSSASAMRATFTAPSVFAGTIILSFSLLVNDGLGVSSSTSSSNTIITVLPVPVGLSNVARVSSAFASIQTTSTSQTADKAIDGVIDGYPGDWTREWAAGNSGAGVSLLLTWSATYSVKSVMLYDRPNLGDHITAATLQLSDGTLIQVGPLNNDGSGTQVAFATPHNINSLLFTATEVSADTQNPGLAEIQVLGTFVSPHTNANTNAGSNNSPPVASSGADQTVISGSLVTLDGSGSTDPDGVVLSYQWTQTAGPNVALSTTNPVRPTFTAPFVSASSGSVLLSFSLMVTDNIGASSTDTVQITVVAAGSTNVAPLAVASASSANSATHQTANKAIDGVIDGYPGRYQNEWATVGGSVGSWLRLTWSSVVSVRYVVLYDRPNLADQITAATIQLSDGLILSVGSLNNDGAATKVVFATPHNISSLLLTVTGTSSSTINVGLAEIQVYS